MPRKTFKLIKSSIKAREMSSALNFINGNDLYEITVDIMDNKVWIYDLNTGKFITIAPSEAPALVKFVLINGWKNPIGIEVRAKGEDLLSFLSR
jgi:hypothetical protein